jgi:AcrR family transcriptional regulator
MLSIATGSFNADKISMEKFSSKSRQRSDSTNTVDYILDTAYQILVTNGYSGFTMRLVAQSAGISLGNLTYHFPRKNTLLRALITRIMADYSRQLDAMFSDPDISSEQETEKLVHWVLMDNASEVTVRISREIWAMALHDDDIRDAVDDFYDILMERLVDRLQRLHPNTDKATLIEKVHILVQLAEGTAVLFGTRRKRTVSIERMVELTTQLLKNLESNQKTK